MAPELESRLILGWLEDSVLKVSSPRAATALWPSKLSLASTSATAIWSALGLVAPMSSAAAMSRLTTSRTSSITMLAILTKPVMLSVLLWYLPGCVATTSTAISQCSSSPAMATFCKVALETLMLALPAVASTAIPAGRFADIAEPAGQLVWMLGLGATVTPAGRLSVKPRPTTSVVCRLARLKVSLDTSAVLTVAGVNLLNRSTGL